MQMAEELRGEGGWPCPAGHGNKKPWGGGGEGDQWGEATYLAQYSPCTSFWRETPTPHSALWHGRLFPSGCPRRPHESRARRRRSGQVGCSTCPNTGRLLQGEGGRTPVHDACMSHAPSPSQSVLAQRPSLGEAIARSPGWSRVLGWGRPGGSGPLAGAEGRVGGRGSPARPGRGCLCSPPGAAPGVGGAE